MSTDTTNRGTCPVCAYSIRLTRAGVIAHHRAPRTMLEPARDCPGGGRPPETPPEVPQ